MSELEHIRQHVESVIRALDGEFEMTDKEAFSILAWALQGVIEEMMKNE